MRGNNTTEPQGQQPAGMGQARPRYSNPQSTNAGGIHRQPRRAGQTPLYKKYVPAQGDEPPQLRRNPAEWQQANAAQATEEPAKESHKWLKMGIAILVIVAATASAVGSAFVLRDMLHAGNEANATTTTDIKASFDYSQDNALDVLTANTRPTDEDMSVITMMYDSLTHEHEIRSQTDSDMLSPDEMMAKVSVNGWDTDLDGWESLQLRVRASEYAIASLKEKYGGTYDVISASIPEAGIGEDGTPESVMVVCRCNDGDDAGVTVSVTVGLSGKAPTMADNMTTVRSQKTGVLDRLNAVIAQTEGLHVGDFALEGFTTPLTREDGTTVRTETWWLYVNSNVAPSNIDDFVAFVDYMFDAFAKTAGDDVVNVDVTVISCDANDPAMDGKTFAELAAELATTNDHGSRYIDFDYVLRGEATTTTPCMEQDLDGRLHPYAWE